MSKGGPATRTGKARSSRNATRHGMLSLLPVVPGLERPEDWEAHRAGILANLAPEGHLESILAERIALQLWRLYRVARSEAASIAAAQERLEDTASRDADRRGLPPTPVQEDESPVLQRCRHRIRLLQEFPAMTPESPLSAEEANDLVVSVEWISGKVDRTSVSVSFMPDDMGIEDYHEWTAAKLRELLAAMAGLLQTSVESLLSKALAFQEEQRVLYEQKHRMAVAQAQQERAAALAQIEREQAAAVAQLERQRRERLLPGYPLMERIARYEAHLSRELYRALHELEALQERRQGRPAPLARLEISGLP